jgi:PAS domain S-box-containing protein
MKKFADFKIVTKFYNVILVALIGMIGITVSDNYQTKKVFESANYCTVNALPSVFLMSNALKNFYEIRVQLRVHILNSDIGKMEVIEKKMQKLSDEIDKSLTMYGESMISNDEDKRLLDEDRATIKKFLDSLEPVLVLSRVDKYQEARDLLATTVVPLATQVDTALNNHMEFNRKLANISATEALESKETAIKVSMLLSFLTIFSVAFISWLIGTRQVSEPLNLLIHSVEKITKGDLKDEVFGVERGDDIGDISRSVSVLRGVSIDMENQRSMKQTLSEIDQALLGAKNYEEFGSILSSKLAPSLNLIYCALYIADEKTGNLKREGGYGCDSKHATHFRFGEGLVGQVAKDCESISMSVPIGDSLVGVVTSGAGIFAMRNMLILPILQNEKMLGVFEVGSTEVIDDLKSEFLHTLMPMIAAKIQILSGVVETAELLKESLVQADIMAEQAARLEEQTVESEMHELESKKTESWLRGIVEATPDAMLIVNSKNNIILCNSKAEQILGYESGELNSKSIDDIAHDVMRGNAESLTVIRKDGREIQIACSLNSIPDLGGRGACTYATIREIAVANEDTKVALQSV